MLSSVVLGGQTFILMNKTGALRSIAQVEFVNKETFHAWRISVETMSDWIDEWKPGA